MKSLISAETVRRAHAAGTLRLAACPRHCVVTPEARTVAARLGVTLASDEAPAPSGAASAVAGAAACRDPALLAAVRAQVRARLPKGSVSDEQLDQIIGRAMTAEQRAPAPTGRGNERKERMEAATDLIASSTAFCRAHPRGVVFPDGVDERAIAAAAKLVQMRALRPVLLGDTQKIRALAQQHKLNLDHVEIVDPIASPRLDGYAANLQQRLAAKGVTAAQARDMLLDPLFFGAMMVRSGDIDCCVAGNLASTAAVLKAALRVVGPAPGMKTVSSVFFMVPPGKGTPLGFADCSVVPEPTTEQLADIAISSAASYQNLTGTPARVAMLSFSTRGSVRHPAVDVVRNAVDLIRQRAPQLLVEGELQFDAAFVPEVAARKVPDGVLGGRANVFVFPTLAAGNTGYKIAERMGGYAALGPLIQGLDAPMHDLSRGCSVQDMIQVPLLAMKMAYGGAAGG